VRVDWTGHFLVRVGRDFGGWLPYVTGGLALANVRAAYLVPVAPQFNASSEDLRAGYDVGGGVERRLPGGWSGRFEFLYDYWGAKRYEWVPGVRHSNIGLYIGTIRVALTRHF
jgi:opacity protein-like surface antigen